MMIIIAYTIVSALLAYIIQYIIWPYGITDRLPENILMWYISSTIIQFTLITFFQGALSNYIKLSEYGSKNPVRSSFYHSAENILSLLLIGFVGSLLSITIILSPLYFLSIASLMISGYKGFDALSEAAKQFLSKRRYLYIIVPDYIIGLSLEALFIMLAPSISMYIKPGMTTAFGLMFAWLVYSRANIRTSREYLYYGLKKCVYCGAEIPIEAVYCSECGMKLR